MVIGPSCPFGMKAWPFHMIGLYPNAGHAYYLINSPFLKETTIKLEGDKSFKVTATNLSDKNIYIKSARLNNKPYSLSWIEHSELMKGGVLQLPSCYLSSQHLSR